ncbi:hypothetical protein PPERSA_03018 [Pseudocohnilembus persalinus]|uniref:Transmembrane protein n=1 Tax=Pseudocohnilembus persalinus TaxID=266149 RepID=A0A0V0QEY4_PSEPJ|nr:hypothetical protein PPERSA_03018 [Pseudocohnilembus persalinus]|eukprot:KRX00758.1 hypothetical protein PPERSA_03018 [Pseudocohnilembus persalinus]
MNSTNQDIPQIKRYYYNLEESVSNGNQSANKYYSYNLNNQKIPRQINENSQTISQLQLQLKSLQKEKLGSISSVFANIQNDQENDSKSNKKQDNNNNYSEQQYYEPQFFDQQNVQQQKEFKKKKNEYLGLVLVSILFQCVITSLYFGLGILQSMSIDNKEYSKVGNLFFQGLLIFFLYILCIIPILYYLEEILLFVGVQQEIAFIARTTVDISIPGQICFAIWNGEEVDENQQSYEKQIDEDTENINKNKK